MTSTHRLSERIDAFKTEKAPEPGTKKQTILIETLQERSNRRKNRKKSA